MFVRVLRCNSKRILSTLYVVRTLLLLWKTFTSDHELSAAQHTTLLKSLSHYLSLSLFLYFTLANIRAVRQFLWSVGVYAVGYVAVVVVVDVVVVFYFFSFSLLCQCFLPGSYRDDNPMPIIDLIVCWFDCINYCSCLVEVFRIAVIAFFVVQNFFCSDFILLYALNFDYLFGDLGDFRPRNIFFAEMKFGQNCCCFSFNSKYSDCWSHFFVDNFC